MDQGFFIATRLSDGTPGRPIGAGGEDDGAIAMFEELSRAVAVRDKLINEYGQLSIYKVNLSFSGEVIL